MRKCKRWNNLQIRSEGSASTRSIRTLRVTVTPLLAVTICLNHLNIDRRTEGIVVLKPRYVFEIQIAHLLKDILKRRESIGCCPTKQRTRFARSKLPTAPQIQPLYGETRELHFFRKTSRNEMPVPKLSLWRDRGRRVYCFYSYSFADIVVVRVTEFKSGFFSRFAGRDYDQCVGACNVWLWHASACDRYLRKENDTYE